MRRSVGLAALCLFLVSVPARAWDKRGHAVVCESAAYLVAEHAKDADFMKSHSFDLGYYCNVPDLVWKKGDLYKAEWFNHFMDKEIFEREMKFSRIEKPFELARHEFERAFPNIKESAGRAYWRVTELFEKAAGVAEQLKATEHSREERQKLQAEWLVLQGVIGHYIGDLSQPLHTTENFDGQLSGQKGIHAWFEHEIVDEVFVGNGPSLHGQVMDRAKKLWKKHAKTWESESVLWLLKELVDSSNKEIAALLKIDKRVGRKDAGKAAKSYRKLIVERMAVGSVALATIWKRGLGWKYDGEKFYAFTAAPEYIAAPKTAIAH